jgi:hypothetical protein
VIVKRSICSGSCELADADAVAVGVTGMAVLDDEEIAAALDELEEVVPDGESLHAGSDPTTRHGKIARARPTKIDARIARRYRTRRAGSSA